MIFLLVVEELSSIIRHPIERAVSLFYYLKTRQIYSNRLDYSVASSVSYMTGTKCPACETPFEKTQIRDLVKVQNTRGKPVTLLIEHCPRCIFLSAFCLYFHLNNGDAIIDSILSRIKEKGDKNLQCAIPVAKEIAKGHQTLASNVKLPLLYMGRQMGNFDLKASKNGKDFLKENPNGTVWEFIFLEWTQGRQASLSNSFTSELLSVRGLTDCRELCNCGRKCGHVLPLWKKKRTRMPIPDAEGNFVEVARGCALATILLGDERFSKEQKPHVETVQGLANEFDINNEPNNIRVLDLAYDDNLRAFETFATSDNARGEEKVAKYKEAKKVLFNINWDGKKTDRETQYFSKNSKEEKRKAKNENKKRHRKTVNYQLPQNVYMRNLLDLRHKEFNQSGLRTNSPTIKLILNCTLEYCQGMIFARLEMDFLPEGHGIETWDDLLHYLGEYHIDEPFCRSFLNHNMADAFSAINQLPIHGALNRRKSTYVTKKGGKAYFKLQKIHYGLAHGEVQTFEQGVAFVKKHKELFQIIYVEMFLFNTTDKARKKKITKVEARQLWEEAGMKELKLSLSNLPWTDLTKKQQAELRLINSKQYLDYYRSWNPKGYGAVEFKKLHQKLAASTTSGSVSVLGDVVTICGGSEPTATPTFNETGGAIDAKTGNGREHTASSVTVATASSTKKISSSNASKHTASSVTVATASSTKKRSSSNASKHTASSVTVATASSTKKISSNASKHTASYRSWRCSKCSFLHDGLFAFRPKCHQCGERNPAAISVNAPADAVISISAPTAFPVKALAASSNKKSASSTKKRSSLSADKRTTSSNKKRSSSSAGKRATNTISIPATSWESSSDDYNNKPVVPASAPLESSVSAPAGEWNCKTCTLKNERRSRRCKMCYSSRE